MSDLTDRYVSEVLRSVPAPMRDDLERELRASIADALDAAADSRPAAAPEALEAQVLTDLGDPARLAASLTDQPQYLIGPGLYWEYRRVLRMLLRIVPPAVALTVSAVAAFAGADPLGVLIQGVWLLGVVAFQVVLWATVGFAIVERTGAGGLPRRRAWTVADLPARDVRRVTLGETVGGVLGPLVGIAGLLWLRAGVAVPGSDVVLPLLDPALWSFWLPSLIVLMSAAVVLHLLAHAAGRWTRPLAAVRVAVAVLGAGIAIVLLLTQQVLNMAWFAALGHPDWAVPGSPLTQGVAWVIGVAAVIDVVDVLRRSRA
jgi:hypothetical protein